MGAMNEKTLQKPLQIAVLGCTGQAGKRIARLLSQDSRYALSLLGRNEEKLAALRASLSPSAALEIQHSVVDLRGGESLSKALEKTDLLIVALSSAAQMPFILETARKTKTDCFDILLSSHGKLSLLKNAADAMAREGRCYITDGGYHPGVPAALVRYAQSVLPGLKRAEIFGSFNVDWRTTPMSPETTRDFVGEMASMDCAAFIQGRWRKGWKYARRFDFGPPIGWQDCIPMGLNELLCLPEKNPLLRDMGFYIGGFGKMMDVIVMPLAFVLLKLCPPSLPLVARLFSWALNRFTSRESWSLMKLVAENGTKRLDMSFFHPDPYDFTAIPVVACVEQYATSPRRPGLWAQAHFVEPELFVEQIKKMGVAVSRSIQSRGNDP